MPLPENNAVDYDDAYSNAAYIADADDYPARWAAQSQAFRDSLGARAQSGLPYGEGPRQVFDLFQPEAQPKGTVIFVHGGYWRAFDSSSWSYLAAGPLAQGWTVAMPSYDLCPNVHIAQISRQVAAAVRKIAEQTEGPLSLVGHSAGGHLVARVLDVALMPDGVADRLHHVVPFSPLSDLRPLLRTAMNEEFRLSEEEAAAESPLLMADRHEIPTTVWVGGDERPAFLDQARWLAEAWDAGQVIVPGKHHFNVVDVLADPSGDLVRTLTS